ncbi:ankyrin, partial [Lophiostoma macrostomum CBS 122681]
NRNQSTQQQKTILDWLGPLSMSHTHRNILSLRSPGTGTWLIEDESYKSWAKTPKNQAIWLRGIPGAGKTVLTSIVVENLLHHNQSDDTAVSFVYCDYNDAAQQTSERILSTILAAIIRHRPLSEQLVDFYNEHDKIGVQPTLTELERVRRVEATRLSSVFVIVDAIDEMKDDIREALLNVLFNLAPYLNIMLVSRPSIDISRQFLRIKTIEANAKDQDIHRYAEYRLMPNKRSQLAAVLEGRSDLRKHAVESVVDQSQGMFRLAQLHLDLLSDMPNARAFRRTLLDLPLGLDAAHNETINRILNQSDVARETAISALKWLTNVRRPITLLELQYALAVESDAEVFDPEGLVDEEYILSVCKGLVTVADEPHGTMVRMVYLSHYTVLEYLKTDNRFHGPATEEQLALACLTHLLFQVNDTRNNGSEDASAQNKNPFHAYAAEFWGVHARGEPEAVLGPRAFQFVGDYKKTGYVRSALASSKSLFRFELANEYFFSRALRKASARGYTDIVQFLLDRAKISDFSVGTLGRALHSASRNGHLEIVKKLIHAGADVNGSYLTPWIAAEDSVPLCVACEHGHADIVEFLLGHTAVSKWYDCSGLPLELAARKAQLDVAKTLISHGADVKFGSVWQGSPLLSAAMAGHVDMMKLLLENGADARATSDCYRKMTPLQIAANGHRSVVEILLDHGASIDGSPDAYLTPLQTAVFHGNIVIIKLLLRRGASPDAPPGKSALLTAIRQGDEDAIKLLLDFGATPS